MRGDLPDPSGAAVAIMTMAIALSSTTMAMDAFQQSSHDPAGYSVSTYIWVTWLSMWGATIAYLQRIKGRVHTFSLWTLLIEWITAPAAGVLAFWACEAAQVDKLLMASSVLLAGYGGKHAVSLVGERITIGRNSGDKNAGE